MYHNRPRQDDAARAPEEGPPWWEFIYGEMWEYPGQGIWIWPRPTIKPMDIDALIEINWRFMIIDFKTHNKELAEAQERALDTVRVISGCPFMRIFGRGAPKSEDPTTGFCYQRHIYTEAETFHGDSAEAIRRIQRILHEWGRESEAMTATRRHCERIKWAWDHCEQGRDAFVRQLSAADRDELKWLLEQ